MAISELIEALSSHSLVSPQGESLQDHLVQCRRNPMSVEMEDGAVGKRCVPTSQRTNNKPMAVRTWPTTVRGLRPNVLTPRT